MFIYSFFCSADSGGLDLHWDNLQTRQSVRIILFVSAVVNIRQCRESSSFCLVVGGNPAQLTRCLRCHRPSRADRVLTGVLNGHVHVGFPFRASQEVREFVPLINNKVEDTTIINFFLGGILRYLHCIYLYYFAVIKVQI
jgi:hypothetical protein